MKSGVTPELIDILGMLMGSLRAFFSNSITRFCLETKENKRNIDSEIPSDLLELNTMFNFAPGSHCVIRKTSKKGCQRRNSTIACSLGSKIGTRSRKIGDEAESINNRRRLSVASMAFPVQKEERRQQKPVYERLTMIESVDNEGGFL